MVPDIALRLPPQCFQHPPSLLSTPPPSSSRSPRCSNPDHHVLPLNPHSRRRLLLLNIASLASSLSLYPRLASPSLAEEAAPDLTITDKVYLDIAKCPSSFSTSRGEGGGTTSDSVSGSGSSEGAEEEALLYCKDGEAMGRIVIGLYGRQVPETVANFKAMCTGKAGSTYKGCLIHRVLAGQYIMAGRQGSSKEKGEIVPPLRLPRNLESVDPRAFKIAHSRPGTVSLCLSENDDEDQFKLSIDYRNVEFLITTGPGPAPQLDNKNIVFGTVLEGLDVVRASATVPTYKPSEQIQQFNELAAFFGDERASNARSFWYRPLTALYISDCGEM